MTISKKFKFDAAHMIKDHFGKCRNLHGHTYQVEIFLTDFNYKINKEDGVVLDYYYLNEKVKPLIEALDHTFIYYKKDDKQKAIADFLIANDMKVYELEMQSTAENLAIHIREKLFDLIDGKDIYLEVVVKETENTSAKVKAKNGVVY